MSLSHHTALFLSNNSDKKLIIQNILSGKYFPEMTNRKIIVFSELTLKELIEKEDRFGALEAMQNTNRSIATLSGGEQKKALLKYCLSQKPDYLILDNPFDNLDIDSQENLKIELALISKEISLIQLVNRNTDKLSFIDTEITVDENNRIPNSIVEFNLNISNPAFQSSFYDKIPEPLKSQLIDYEQLVKLENVTIKYEGRTIIKNINWEIKKGEFWQLIGPNGAGKTTILSMIIGDNPKAFGQNITLFGQLKGSGEAVWDIKKMIGYFTPSMINLFARNTSLEHMIVSGLFDSIGLYNLPSERQLRLANEWLKVLNLKHLARKPFYRLTIGQQRLAMIARAMIKHPPILILDEPIAGLDDANALIICKLINKIADESSTAILYVSHRKEADLNPKYIYELTPSELGSNGKVISK